MLTPIRTSSGGASSLLPRARWTAQELVLWGALGLALSPCWFDLAAHWRDEAWARPAALFLPLTMLAAARQETRPPPRRDGLLLVAAALLWMILAAGGGVTRLGRPAVPLAVFGLARALGRPSPAAALLALWIIPPPSALLRLFSPAVQEGFGSAAVAVAQAAGLPASFSRRVFLEIGGASLRLEPADAGVALVVFLAGVGWWSAARVGGSLRAAAAAALRLAPFGLLAQGVALGLAFVLLALGAPQAARSTLDLAAWPVLALALLWVGGSRAPRTRARIRLGKAEEAP